MPREALLVFLSPLTLVVVGALLVAASRPAEEPPAPGVELYEEVMGVVADRYVVAPDTDALALSAARAILDGLDPHCRLYDASEWSAQRTRSQGEYAGIGVLVGRLGGRIAVLEVTPGGPAARAGVRAGELLLRIDGELVDDERVLREAVAALGGPFGSRVRLTLGRLDSEVERVVEVVRGIAPRITAWGRSLPEERIGQLVVTRFAGNTVAQFRAALDELIEGGARGLVLDLRGNRGGSLTAALEVADTFLEEGEILATVGRTGAERFRATRTADDCPLPLVVLLDGRSASASEVVAGALRDHARAVLVGARSYGKGVVQDVRPLRSREGGLKITTKHYFTPAGSCIEGHVALPGGFERDGGLVPDVPVTMGERDWALARRARERARFHPEVRTRLAEEDPIPADHRDAPLEAARALLSGRGAPDAALGG